VTMTLPTAINLHTTDHDVDARARGVNGTPSQNTKANGNLPLSTNASGHTNNTGTSQTGALDITHWEFLATGGYDVSSDTRVLIFTLQFNAPNRLQLSDTANNGFICQIGSGTGSPPTDYKRFRVLARDKLGGSSRANPIMIVIDLNDTSNEESGGTFDNTDVETYAQGSVRWDMVGTSTHFHFLQRAFVFTTTKASSDIPTFTATSDWDDLVDLLNGTSYATKISDEWAKREGNIYSIVCPIQFGDNSVETDFNDNGAIVFWPDSNTTGDPRVRVTSQAFRVYANLRNNAADTLTLSGQYDCGGTRPAWDFDLDFAATITLTGASFKKVGTFTMGSSVTGAATFDDCGVITINNNGADLDGSTFKNPDGNHLLRIPV